MRQAHVAQRMGWKSRWGAASSSSSASFPFLSLCPFLFHAPSHLLLLFPSTGCSGSSPLFAHVTCCCKEARGTTQGTRHLAASGTRTCQTYFTNPVAINPSPPSIKLPSSPSQPQWCPNPPASAPQTKSAPPACHRFPTSRSSGQTERR
jgi:hypothetical protein